MADGYLVPQGTVYIIKWQGCVLSLQNNKDYINSLNSFYKDREVRE